MTATQILGTRVANAVTDATSELQPRWLHNTLRKQREWLTRPVSHACLTGRPGRPVSHFWSGVCSLQVATPSLRRIKCSAFCLLQPPHFHRALPTTQAKRQRIISLLPHRRTLNSLAYVGGLSLGRTRSRLRWPALARLSRGFPWPFLQQPSPI